MSDLLPQLVSMGIGAVLVISGCLVIPNASVKRFLYARHLLGITLAYYGIVCLVGGFFARYAATWSWEGVIHIWAEYIGTFTAPLLGALFALLLHRGKWPTYAILLCVFASLIGYTTYWPKIMNPVFEGPNEHDINASYERVVGRLSASERQQLDEALDVRNAYLTGLHDGFFSESMGPLSSLTGKDASQVIADLHELDRQMHAWDLKTRDEYAKRVRADREEVEMLSKVTVSNPRTVYKGSGSGYPDVTVYLTVDNRTSMAIKTLSIKGVVGAQRSIPWAKWSVQLEISGGIEPGETYKTTVKPSALNGYGASIKEIPNGENSEVHVSSAVLVDRAGETRNLSATTVTWWEDQLQAIEKRIAARAAAKSS